MLDDEIAKRIRKLNPYYSGSLSEPNSEDIDKLIVQAAYSIQHPPRPKKKQSKNWKIGIEGNISKAGGDAYIG